jgi:DNA-binding response OmpR family regulator
MWSFERMDESSANDRRLDQWTGSDDSNRCQLELSPSRRIALVANVARAAPPRPLRVLIVDATRDTADTLSVLVQLWGHAPTCAYDGASGLAMAATVMPHVVVLDLALPGINGCQLAAKLRHSAGLKDCLLIAVTGYADERHRRLSQEAGIDVHLVKPVEAVILETLLILERRRLQTLPAIDLKDFGVMQESVLM